MGRFFADAGPRGPEKLFCEQADLSETGTDSNPSEAVRYCHKVTMAERFIISIDFESPGSNDNGLIDFDILTRLDRILITVKPGNYDKARSFLNKNFNRCSIAVDSTAIDSPDDVVSLLDNGAAHIFVTGPMFQKIISLKRLADYSRLVLSLAGEASDGTIEEMATHIRSFWETCSPESERRGVHLNSSSQSNLFQVLTAGATQGNDGSCPYDCYISLDSSTLSNYEKAVQDGKIAIIPIECLTLDKKRQPHCLSIERLLVAALSSDRKDGLFSTIVTNTQGVCLGLVYSNEESIKASLVSGRGVYKSRKRTELWYKGATSGDIQELIHIHLDCDGDALVFVVRQLGRGKT